MRELGAMPATLRRSVPSGAVGVFGGAVVFDASPPLSSLSPLPLSAHKKTPGQPVDCRGRGWLSSAGQVIDADQLALCAGVGGVPPDGRFHRGGFVLGAG